MPSRNSSRIAALFLMLAAAGPGLAQNKAADAKPANLAGTVVDSGTGEPIAKVHVFVQVRIDDTQVNRSAVTDGQGKFSLSALPPGYYWPRAERTGFVMPAGRTGFVGPAVQLHAGENKDDLTIKLAPAGSVSGRVVDVGGEPVESVSVSAEGTLGMIHDAQTDDEGRFRIGGLPPGNYRLLARTTDLPLPPEIRTDGTVETNNASTYYPSSLMRRTAGRIEVAPGGQVSGIEIRMVRTPIVGMSGTVSGFPKGSRVTVDLRNGATFGAMAMVKPDGTFAAWRLAPGKYGVSASMRGQAGMGPNTPEVEVEVASTNIEHVDLVFADPIDLAGRVEFDDPNAQPASSRPIQVNSFGGVSSWNTIHPGADGSFTAEKVAPVRYRLQYIGLGYVKSVRLGTVETPGDILDLRHVAAGSAVTVVIATDTGSIEGKVADDGTGMSGVKVAVVPDTPDGAAMARFVEIRPDGSYSATSLPPGDYKLAIIDDLDENAVRNGDGLDDYKDVAVSVTVSPKAKTQQDLSRAKR